MSCVICLPERNNEQEILGGFDDYDDEVNERSGFGSHNAEFVAAVNPQVVLALLGEIESLNTGVAVLEREKSAYYKAFDKLAEKLGVFKETDPGKPETFEVFAKIFERLEKEADWLASELAKFCSSRNCEECEHSGRQWEEYCYCKILSLGVNSSQTWREAARRAVEEQCKSN